MPPPIRSTRWIVRIIAAAGEGITAGIAGGTITAITGTEPIGRAGARALRSPATCPRAGLAPSPPPELI